MALPDIRWNPSQMPVETIVVNTNKDGIKDDRQTTLREALLKAEQGANKKSYDIVFNANDTSSATNKLRLNYWTIELDSPLIFKSGNARLNFTQPQNVTLVPSAEEGKSIKRKDITGLLVQAENDNKIASPSIALNRINFAGFTAKGGDAKPGGGGGGGMGGGGAIVLRGGDVYVTNSVFQNNQAIGGKGAKGARGGPIDTIDTWRRTYGFSNQGENGGPGGKPSFPDSENVIVKTSVGGKTPKSRNFVRRSYLQHNYNSTAGGDGAELTQKLNDGYGGYGGAGGGGGLVVRGVVITYSKAGNGGRGGFGGLGAGSGGGGGAGTLSWRAVGRYPKPSGGKGGIAPAWGTAGGSGKSYGSGNPGERNSGGKGGNGSALGGAIAVMSGYVPTALNLWNVDFVHNSAKAPDARTVNQLFHTSGYPESKINFLKSSEDDLDGSVNYWLSQDSLQGNGRVIDPKERYVSNSDIQIIADTVSVEAQDESSVGGSPVYLGRSYMTNPEVVRLRPISQKITNHRGLSETNIIQFDTSSSGRIFVNGDFADFENGIKDIWKYLYPDKSAEINNEYGSSVLQSIFGTVAKTLTGGYGIAFPNITTDDKVNSLLKGNIFSFAKTVLTDYFEKEKALKKNAADQAKLRQKLEQNLNARFAPIDISTSRTTVEINDFTLGEDILQIPDLGSQPPDIGIQGGGYITITNGKNDGNPNIIAKLKLDPISFSELDQSGRSPAGYISNMFFNDPDIGGWKLGKKASYGYLTQFANTYIGGPASTSLFINRKGKPLSQLFTTTLFSGDDQIIGTMGRESIEAGGGMDIIYPKGGKDSVNGDDGIDYLVLSDLQNPVNVKYDNSTKQFSATAPDNSIDSVFENIEVINAYSGSNVDYSALPEPDSDVIDHWGARIGARSQFVGSNFNDRIVLSFQDEEFSAINQLSSLKTIDGGNGYDTLEIDAPPDLDIHLEPSESCGEVSIRIGSVIVNEFKNIEEIYFKGTKSDNYFKPCIQSMSTLVSFNVIGGTGDDIIHGGTNKSTIHGGAHDDLIYGKRASDKLTGGRGNDTIKGGSSSDTIRGGSGIDIIDGGKGSDHLWGGKHEDQFVLSKGKDVIYDFDSNDDQLLIPESMHQVNISPVGRHTLISNTNGTHTIVKDTQPSDVELIS